MIALDAYHLPGLREADVARWNLREYDDGEVRLRVPVLEPTALERIVDRLREARARHLAARPVDEIVQAIDRAAERLARPDDPHRAVVERALPAVTGYSAPMVRLILDQMTADWREKALRSLLHAEFDDPLVLDAFRPRTPVGDHPVRIRALGPEFAFHIFAGNVPGVAVTSLVRSLLVKAATLGKAASGDPLLPALFARILADVAPQIGDCIAVTYWPGGSVELEEVALGAADTIVIYGGKETVEAIRARAPAGTRLVEHGPRLSLALVGREALTREHVERTAADAARAAAIFDQQGCVSPHLIYVEEGGETDPADFAARLAEAMGRIEDTLPRGRLTPAEAATIHQVRGAAEFRSLGGQDVRLYTGNGTGYTVIYDADPTFSASCLNRVVWVKPLGSLVDAVGHLRPFAAFLQTVGVAADAGRRLHLADALGHIGVSRITDLERMPWPPPSWHHDGQEPLRELVRWVDLEG